MYSNFRLFWKSYELFFLKNVSVFKVFLRCIFLMINRLVEKYFNWGDKV